MSWLSLVLAALKLLGTFADYAKETRRENETIAAALGRVLDDAGKTVERACIARADVERRARAGELLNDDGERRD